MTWCNQAALHKQRNTATAIASSKYSIKRFTSCVSGTTHELTKNTTGSIAWKCLMCWVCSILGYECKADLDFLHHEPGHTSQSRAKAQVHHAILCKPHQAWLLFSSHTQFAMFGAVKQPLYLWGKTCVHKRLGEILRLCVCHKA